MVLKRIRWVVLRGLGGFEWLGGFEGVGGF